MSREVDFTEALFVVVIMAMAATRPILWFAESAMARIAALGGDIAARLVADHPDDRTILRLVPSPSRRP